VSDFLRACAVLYAPVSAVGAASGRANETAGPVYYTPIGSNGANYSWGDAIINQEQTASATITARATLPRPISP
jgi:hypothetical protein